MEITIREIHPDDVVAINALSKQLGYPLTEEQTLQNIKLVLVSKDHTAFVAVHENKIAGWLGLAHTILIEVLPYCEINGIVVDEAYRGKGVGKLLIEKAKQWAREKGNTKLKLHCNIIRTEAHKFYGHLGFIETKQQKNFELNI